MVYDERNENNNALNPLKKHHLVRRGNSIILNLRPNIYARFPRILCRKKRHRVDDTGFR